MDIFSNRQKFMFASFDLTVEEERVFSRFYRFLDDSGVEKSIEKSILNTSKKGGRPNVNYYNLFATVLYGFALGRSTLREMEDACGHDIRFINIMEQVRPSYSTISNFINNAIVPYRDEIFGCINKQILKEMRIALDDAFIDGTKWEANANKYKFVWKPVTFHKRISVSFFNLLEKNGLCPSFRQEELVRSSTITKAIDALEIDKHRFESKQYETLLKALGAMLTKVLEYEEKELICGENRKSYYKTDHDATAMSLKADYYTGNGSVFHAAYNVQALVVKGLVLSYFVSQERSDTKDFVSTVEKFHKIYGEYPKNICADSGYGSFENYSFLEKNNIGNYVKHQSWEGNASGSYPDQYRMKDSKTIICLNGRTGSIVEIPGRHPKKANSVFFEISNCEGCGFKNYCMRFVKNPEIQTSKIFEVNIGYMELKQKAEANLLSPKGIEMRVNRSIQVEGVFGIEKQDFQYIRTRRRGLEKVSAEIMLTFLGLNLKRLLKFFETGDVLSYWVAPPDLQPETFKKPSAKRLSKKGEKTHNKIYNTNI